MPSTEQIWRDYHRQLHRFIQRRVADSAVADDILQDVFLKIHTRLASVASNAALPSWLYTLTRNAIIDYYRGRKPTAELPDDVAERLPEWATDETEQLRTELAECLAPLIAALPEAYRKAIVLSELEGLTQQEVARRLGLSLSGAKSRVQRGRDKLKDMLLDCCRFELGRDNAVLDYEPRRRACRDC